MICPICNVDYQNLTLHLRAKHPESSIPGVNTLSAVRAVDEDVWTKQKRQLERMNEVLLLQLQQQQLVKAMQSGNSPFTPAPATENMSTFKDAIHLIKEIQGMGQPQSMDYEPEDPLMSGAIDIIKASVMSKINVPPPPQVIENRLPWKEEEEEEIPPPPKEEEEKNKEVEENELDNT